MSNVPILNFVLVVLILIAFSFANMQKKKNPLLAEYPAILGKQNKIKYIISKMILKREGIH